MTADRPATEPRPFYDGPVCSRCGHEPHDDRPDPRCGEIVGGWDQPMPTPDYCGCADVDALWTRLIRAEAAQGAAPLRLLERFAPIMADHPLWVERRVCNAPGCGDEDYFDHIRAIERGYPMNDFSGDDLDRAIAIVEDSRQTHVNWAEWRRKGNGTDTDHEMIGDLEWHENAIRDYDHVLSVLRAAPRAEGQRLDWIEITEEHEFGVEAMTEPRTAAGRRLLGEGLDRTTVAKVLHAMREGRGGLVSCYHGADGSECSYHAALFLATLARPSRPSDERVPESEEPLRAPQEGRADDE